MNDFGFMTGFELFIEFSFYFLFEFSGAVVNFLFFGFIYWKFLVLRVLFNFVCSSLQDVLPNNTIDLFVNVQL